MVLKKESIDIKAMLEDRAKSYELLAGKKGLIWKTDIQTSSHIVADRHRLWDVFDNLVNNAIKFTPEKGVITLGARDGVNEVIIFVKDSGVGIKKDDLDRIFAPFEQGQQADPSVDAKGVGLGLSIGRKIVELHNGTLTAQSQVGEGSCFTVTLPR